MRVHFGVALISLLPFALVAACAQPQPGVVSAAAPAAADAGWEMLLAGGNAADAAVGAADPRRDGAVRPVSRAAR